VLKFKGGCVTVPEINILIPILFTYLGIGIVLTPFAACFVALEARERIIVTIAGRVLTDFYGKFL